MGKVFRDNMYITQDHQVIRLQHKIYIFSDIEAYSYFIILCSFLKNNKKKIAMRYSKN